MDDKKNINEAAKLGDVEVGEILRRTRVHYGQSLKDVEKVLRIRQIQIDAIEKGEIYKLPGRVYAIGFVRSYAEYLGLDGAKVVQLFKAQYMDRQPKEVLSFPVPASETKAPPLWVVGLSVIIIITLIAIWSYLQSSGQSNINEIQTLTKETKDRITERIQTENIVSAADGLEASPSSIIKQNLSLNQEDMGHDNSKKSGIILNIKSNSWVEVKDVKGTILVSDVLNKGDQYYVPDSPGLTMSLGNAGGVEIILNGMALMPLGKDGDVLRDIPLDTNHLKTLEFKTPDLGNISDANTASKKLDTSAVSEQKTGTLSDQSHIKPKKKAARVEN